ncbi:MAG: hypothetical protein IKR56_04800 [Lachnospiraceae bacterium]|nr:hypothetical protein [Lachnospiraceae bacterium]
MDYFFDKLSDRINASQDRGSGRDYEQGAQAQAAAVDNSELERIIDERLALYKEQIVEEIKSGVAQSVSDSNAMCVEMISQSAQEGNTARLSATEEIMAALVSTKNDISDAVSMNGHTTKEDLTELITGIKEEYLTRDELIDEIMAKQSSQAQLSEDVISDIADEVAHRVRQEQGAPVSEEGIAEAVAAALAVSMAAPASKEEIADEVAATLSSTLDSHKLEISEIADAVAEKVRENQAVPVSEEEIARILSEKLRENRVEPVSKEEIAQIVAEKILENKTAPVSKEDIAAAVAADMAVTLAAQKLEISDIADAVAIKVREDQAVPVSEDEIARILSEKLRENRVEPVSKEEIAQIVAEKIQEYKEAPISKEEIAQIVAEKIQENKETPVSKEDIAAAVAADMAVTLAAQKLEISDIADAVAIKVRENQAVPVSEEEIARILSEKLRENRVEPVSKEEIAEAVSAKLQENKETPISKEEIAQIVESKIQENKETPVSKEEIVSAVENVVSAKLSAMPHLSKTDIVTAMTVAWASNKTDIVDSVNEGFEKADIGVAKVVDSAGADVKQELTEKIDRTSEELSDHVHKECVKVYKNVQAVLEEGLQHQKEEIDADAASREKNLRDIVDVNINTALRDNQKSENDNTKNIINDTVSSLLNTNTGEKLSTIKNMMLAIICMLGINLLGILVIILWIFQII